MADISATDASKRFADLLDAVEHRGESFTIVRRGRTVATISPVRHGTWSDLRRIFDEYPLDDEFARDVDQARQFILDPTVRDPWTD